MRCTDGLLIAAAVALAMAVPGVAYADLSAEVRALHEEVAALTLTEDVQIYVGAAAGPLLLRRVQVQIDEQPPFDYEYSSFESAALQRGGLHRLHAGALAPGVHRLRAQFIARRADAGPLTPRVELRLDQAFEMGAQALSLQLTLAHTGGWRDRALLNLAQSQPPDAAQVRRAARYAIDAREAWVAAVADAPSGLPSPDVSGAAAIVRYNEAVTMLREGRRDTGIAALTQIAGGEAPDADALRVRDLANLTLGHQLLRERRNAEAAEALRRVRSPGPYGNAALLALGWSRLLPQARTTGDDDPAGAAATGMAWPLDAADTPALRRRMPFRYNAAVAAGERERDLRVALVPWNELSGGDPFDPVVQEGMLVVAYALQHLGAQEQAQRHYLRSIERLQQTGARLDDALAQARDGRLLALVDAQTADGWRRWLADLPYDDATAYVRILAGDAAVVDALEARRPLRFQRDLLAQDAQALATVADSQDLRTRVELVARHVKAALDAADARVVEAASAALQARAKITRGYLAEARFALARLHDPVPRAAQQLAGAAP
ncbi:hypothetical protein AAG565_07040 [Fontimonas sp. SYSU GA230001]|uniref:hypothetical protein n=1 Tax=Fontimonas sp. SYSU GA230001 TaxID=3142450 RepID=UPI0032B60555